MRINTNTQTNNEKLKIINNYEHTSPAFDGEMDPIQLLETLDNMIERIAENPSNTTIQKINEELDQWQIVTMERDNIPVWITSPLTIRILTLKRSFSNRLSNLFRTKGEWRGDVFQRTILETSTHQSLPLSLVITNDTKNEIINDKLHTLLVSLSGLHRIVYQFIKQGEHHIGVFEKPFGVINMNRIRGWLEKDEIDHDNQWGAIKHSLATQTLKDVVNQVTFSVDKTAF